MRLSLGTETPLRLAAVLSVALLLVSCGNSKKKEKISHQHGVVAIVNGEPIFMRDLRREMGSDQVAVGNRTADFILQNMIDQTLLLQEAKRRGLKVPDELLARLAFGNRNATSAKEKRWEKRLRDLWLIGKVAEAICPVKPPSDNDTMAYYQAHKDEFFVKDGVVLRQIVLSTKEEAEKLRRRLRGKGLKEFAKAAKEYSIGPEGRFGGKLGLIKRGEEPPGFEVVFKLKPGTLSKVVRTDYGYHIFFVEKHVQNWYAPLGEVKGEIRRALLSQQGSRCLSRWLREARKRSKIEIYRKELLSLVGEGE